MSSSPETPTHPTGAHPAHTAVRKPVAPCALQQKPPMRYEPYLDGLFTYCLSVLCDHDTATAALGDVLVVAERRGRHGPDAEGDRKAWLYALARWSCLRRLAEARSGRQGSSAPARRAPRRRDAPCCAAGPAEPSAAEQERRQRELALLAWPEAAGTTPEQREALELAVRHQLAPREVAAVLGMDPVATRELLSSAACEVERTRAALAVVEAGGCPGVARFACDSRLMLSSALRLDLVRHVDDCPRCRRTAERAAPGVWPGTSVTPAALPVVAAPRAALHSAMAHGSRARGGGPRFDRRGFPMDPKDHAARRHRLRARVVTTTVVATVVAAPVFALWAAYRGAPLTGEDRDGRPVAANEAHGRDALGAEPGRGYENAGNARTKPDAGFSQGSDDVSVEVIGATGKGHLDVTARSSGDITLIRITASGRAPVHWSARAVASWLHLSRSSGTLAPGDSSTIRVYVDRLREPRGRWTARVSVAPAAAVVSIEGHGPEPRPSAPAPRPSSPQASASGPADPGTPPGGPTPTSGPQTTPTPSSPTPSDPSGPSDPPDPSDPGGPTPDDSGDPGTAG
ncbi:BACON domain-containing protein [Streptomyces cavernae]|uniref:BACON domain-containing protein n=1 Tax=Streptomyces cavernae TaxID=2259034 RepID=UPI0012D9F475|nr:sigma-70 family RNA polymerase sigma factor [Streptomyces cavernae]